MLEAKKSYDFVFKLAQLYLYAALCTAAGGWKTTADVQIYKLGFYVNVEDQRCVCVGGECTGRWSGFALAVFILSVFPRSLFPPTPLPLSRHCVLHQTPSIPQSFEKVGALFSFLLLLLCFRESVTYWNREKQKKERKKKDKTRGVASEWKDDKLCQKTRSVAAALKRWSAYAAECIDCIVRPCVQKPWYCLHSLINVFCMVWCCCHGDPRIGRLKRGNVCMKGVGEKEKGALLAWSLTDGLTQEHGTVCAHAYWSAQIVVLLNLLPSHVFFFLVAFSFWNFVALLPCHHICSRWCTHWESCCIHSQASIVAFVLKFMFALEASPAGLNPWLKLKMADIISLVIDNWCITYKF